MEQLELRTLAHQDFLTGALTRRAFCDGASVALRQQARDGSTAALLIFDVDHFKVVNDRFGHGIGDQVLKGAVANCHAILRPGDLLGRIGGEEFAVLLPATDFGSALACAERLRSAIKGVPPNGCPVVSASFGLALAEPGDTVEQWLAAADAALYEAKRGGRNRCVAAERERCAAA